MHVDPTDEETRALRQQVNFAAQRVLELGAGDGRLAWALAEPTAQWVALDPDAAEVQAGRQNPPMPPVAFVLGDARALPLPAAAFDIAFFSWSLC